LAYDGLTFSSSLFLLEDVKDEIWKHNGRSCFYFEIGFDTCLNVGLCYDYNFSYENNFEICYYDTRNNGWKQIRTYL
jgi:hypothetical protein